MKILTLLIMFITVFFNDNSTGTDDYNPRPLHKNLEKFGMCAGYEKQELQFTDTILRSTIAGKFFSVRCSDNNIMYVYIGRVNSCRAGGCSMNRDSREFEFFDYYTIYDSLFNVLQVNVFNYEATHGQEITSKGWLRQFVGYNGSSQIEAGKNIDAISGATISVNGIINDIKEKTKLLHELADDQGSMSDYYRKH